MRLRLLLVLFVLVYGTGTLLVMWAEDLSLLDALYFMVVTLTTIGYGDVVPHTKFGKIIILLYVPIALALFLGLGLGIVAGRLESALKGAWHRMERQLRKMEDHVIVCGYGRLGSVVVRELKEMGERVVVVDQDEEKLRRLAEDGTVVVAGDAREDAVLHQAGMERARKVITTFGDDTINVYVVLTVRDQRPDVEVISAASNEDAVRHLTLAGAHRVVSAPLVAGKLMARQAAEEV